MSVRAWSATREASCRAAERSRRHQPLSRVALGGIPFGEPAYEVADKRRNPCAAAAGEEPGGTQESPLNSWNN